MEKIFTNMMILDKRSCVIVMRHQDLNNHFLHEIPYFDNKKKKKGVFTVRICTAQSLLCENKILIRAVSILLAGM